MNRISESSSPSWPVQFQSEGRVCEGWQSRPLTILVAELGRLANSDRVTGAAETTILDDHSTTGIGGVCMVKPKQNRASPQGREFKKI